MLLYADHLQNRLDYGYGLVIFLIWVLFWLFFWKTHWGNGLKFCLLIYPEHFQNWLDIGYSFLILMLFWFSETGKIWGFQAFWSCSVNFPHYGGEPFFGWNWSYLGFLAIIWRTCGSKCQGEGGGIFPTLCVECCLVSFYVDASLMGEGMAKGGLPFPDAGCPVPDDGHIYLMWND